MRKDTFFKDSLTLTLSNLATGILGFMFSIILSRELGPEGMGLYGLVMPIYSLFICLICGGMVTAISKVAAVYFAKGDYRNLNKSVDIAFGFDFIWAILITLLVAAAAPFISRYIIKDLRTLTSLLAICPALIFVALSSILKGYFYGVSKVKIPAFIDIFEKAVRIAVLLSVMQIFMFKEVKHTVMAAYIALTIGEFVSFVLLYTYYRINRLRFRSIMSRSEGRAQLLFDILVVSFPLCLNGFLSTALATLSTLIVPRRLVSAGIQYSAALSMIGKFSGMAFNIIFFPMVVVNSISLILVPDLSQNMTNKNVYASEKRIHDVLRLAFLLGLSTFVICFTAADSLGQLFFHRNDLGVYIRFISVCTPITYISATTYAVLNGLGKQGILLRNSMIVSVMEVILLYIFTGIPSVNIFGIGICAFIVSSTTLFLNMYEIKKICTISFSVVNFFIYLLMGLLLYFVLSLLNHAIPITFLAFRTVFIIISGFSLFFLFSSFVDHKSSARERA